MAGKTDTSPGALSITIVLVVFAFCVMIAFVLSTQSMYLTVSAVLGVVLFAIAFLNPRLSLYILIFSMLLSPEFGTRDISGEGFTIRFEDLFLVLMGLAWLARSAIYKDIGLVIHSRLSMPIILYVLACIVSTAVGIIRQDVESPLTGVLFVVKYIEYFFVFFLVMNNIHSKAQLQRLLMAIMITYVIVIIVGLSQVPGGERISAPFEGSQGEPNTLGGYLVIMLAVNLTLFLNMERMLYKVVLGTLAFVCFIALLLTLSRASWLAMVFMYLSLLVLSRKRRILMLALVVGMFVGPLMMPDSVIDRILYTFGKERGIDTQRYDRRELIRQGMIEYDTSTRARFDSMNRALRDFTRRPLFGYGITGYSFLDAQYHRVLVETGLLGFIAFLYLLWVTGRSLFGVFRSYPQDNLYHAIALGTFCAFVGLLAHAVGTNTFIIVRIMEPFWCLAGMGMAIPHIAEHERIGETGLPDSPVTV